MLSGFRDGLSIWDKIGGWVNLLAYGVNLFSGSRAAYENYFEVLSKVWMGKYPIKATLKNGESTFLNSLSEALLHLPFCNIKELKYDFENDVVFVLGPNNKQEIKLYGGVRNGDVIGIFIDNNYAGLPVKDKVVVDIGANIADSSIFFALQGARKVIALEPFPGIYQVAKKNIEENDLSEAITILLAGCAGIRASISLDPNLTTKWLLEKSENGDTIPLVTLECLLQEYDIGQDAVLKMDCEGCEYDAIILCHEETLRRFGTVQIEYHSGYKRLKEKLEKCGFKVSVTRPMRQKTGYIGWIRGFRES